MATGGEEYPGPVYRAITQRSHYPYFFHIKHHRAGPSDDAQWLFEPDLTLDQEFAVFDLADLHILADEHGNLYGMRPRAGQTVFVLGTRGEQLAKFPVTRSPRAWHGYPIWPIEVSHENDRLRPVPDAVLLRMVEQELISSNERRRLKKGKHI